MVLFLIYFQPFLPYPEREQHYPRLWLFPVVTLIGGFLLSLGAGKRRFLVPTCLLLTLFTANAGLIVIDLILGTDHNLFPIEFIFIALFTLPAYVGAFLAAAIDRSRNTDSAL